ncbi:hypothetical protein COM21_29615 [Bacillus toyonensis]|uniref:hypothetical protein n=1 Tax=Bacillus TaxID=1386 RepID=UPI000278D6B8|nr:MULTISPECIES: hypothetical protein [Bacillus cereus group]KAB0449441.1 hypothetical protein CH334_04580 [Lysinibacillus sp. VIA-II-2016]OFC99328.1 hypothetical protein BTGOE7_58430 [Bacillus thuringiensis]EJQ31393.1 hypothetical protein IEC_05617 [Bacillus toyonensis]EJV90169.1 hypothetical protein IGI_05429 [Bacillus toyonensis]EOP46210.1 hypothetical protein IKI_05164 [Bacillus toyonensis]
MNKKIIGSVIGFIVIIIALVSMNMVQKNSEETEKQKKKEANNIASAAAFYIATETMGMISEDVLSGYSTTWSNAINNRKDFNLAIAEKKKSFDKTIDTVSSTYIGMEMSLRELSEAAKEQPEKYKELYEEYKKMYSTITALKEQMESPSGTLITFNQNANELLQEYKKTKGNIDVIISDEIKGKIIKVKEEVKNNK